MVEIGTEYAVRYTSWADLNGEEVQRIRVDVVGGGEEGLNRARHTAAQTRGWQAIQGLPVDAVPVSRPIHDWTEVRDA